VVVGVNDYTVGLFNGDDGVVLGNRAHFGAEDGTREVARSRLPNHQLGYASTIHRSQGSEFEEVMIVLPPADAKLLTRELLYVAVSRAKRAVTLVGDENALETAIERTEESRSGVLDILKGKYAKAD
jgi:exodeoxyribonuclease V alpha subunit